eukprot:8410495-Lingulodinium_polyedra.AAC.1
MPTNLQRSQSHNAVGKNDSPGACCYAHWQRNRTARRCRRCGAPGGQAPKAGENAPPTTS